MRPLPERDGVQAVQVVPIHEARNEPSSPAPPPANEPKRPAQMTPEELRDVEPDVVDYLFRSVDRSERQVALLPLDRFQVPRRDEQGHLILDETGELVLGRLELRLRPLHQAQLDEADRRCRRVWRTNDRGRREQVADQVELSSWYIWLALVEEDRAIFQDKRMWDRFKVGGAFEVIEKLLYAGEKIKAANAIRRISGIPLTLEDEQESGLLENLSADRAAGS
jgi:Phage XkdN-like tail assembly chaperone protein, TAC